MLEFEQLFGAVNPLMLVALVAGLVELVKRLVPKLDGIGTILVSMLLGVLTAIGFMFMTLYPDTLNLPVKVTVYGLMFGLYTSGLVSLTKSVAGFAKTILSKE